MILGLVLKVVKAAVKTAGKVAVKTVKNKIHGVKQIPKIFSSKKAMKSFAKSYINKQLRPLKVVKNIFRGRSDTKSTGSSKESIYKGRTNKKLTGRSCFYTGGSTLKEKLVNEILKKSALVERLLKTEESILRTGSNATIEETEIIKDVIKNPELVKNRNRDELEDINELINNELGTLGVTNDNFEEVMNNDAAMFELAKQNAFNEHINQWKERFYDSDTTQHLSDAEKDEIWQEIEETRTYGWFVDAKVNKVKEAIEMFDKDW